MQTLSEEKIPWWSDDELDNNKIIFVHKVGYEESSFQNIMIKSRIIYSANVIITFNFDTDSVYVLKNRYNNYHGLQQLNVYDFQKKLIEYDIKYMKKFHEIECLHKKFYDENKDLLSALDLNLI